MWQAVRKLQSEDGRQVEVSLGVPEMIKERDWRLAFQIAIDGKVEPKTTSAHDGFECIQMALYEIWEITSELGCYQYGYPAKDSGFYRPLILDPTTFDLAKINGMIDAEIERMADEKIAIGEAKLAARNPTDTTD